MVKRSNPKSTPWYVLMLILLVVASIVLAIAMIAPLWLALSAGLVNVSIVLFSTSIVLSVILLLTGSRRTIRIIATSGIIVGVIALALPQILMLRTAYSHEAQLVFNPINYLTFSGSTSLQPSKVEVYKTLKSQKLSVSYYEPEGIENPQLVVFFHGGAWRYGSHLETGMWPEILTKQGFAVASVQYRLSNDTYHSWEDTPADIHDAINYLKNNPATFSFDRDQIHLMGHSAGGHLALLEAYRFESIESVVALYAPIDLALDYETSRDKSAELDFIGGPPKQFPERYEALSPITYIDQDEPRTLLIQGLYDDLVHPSQTTRLQGILNNFGVKNEIVLLPMTGHSFENQQGGLATQISHQKVLRFLKQ